MLRKKSFKKIIITTFVFFVALTLYIIPSKKNYSFVPNINYFKTRDISVYLLNDYNQLTKYDFKINEMSLDSTINSIIDKLTVSNDVTIPSNFKQVIPYDVTVKKIYLDEGIINIEFSDNFLDINDNKIKSVVESIAYSLFELDKISGVSIYVKDKNISNYYDVPSLITRDYGINKRSNLKDFNDVSKVVIYYLDKDNDYYVPITRYINDDRDKIKIIIDELSSNYVYESNLVSLLDRNVKLLNYEIKNDSMILDFNNSIFIDKDNLLEEVIYSISYSVFANYDVSSVIFKVNGIEYARESLY